MEKLSERMTILDKQLAVLESEHKSMINEVKQNRQEGKHTQELVYNLKDAVAEQSNIFSNAVTKIQSDTRSLFDRQNWILGVAGTVFASILFYILRSPLGN